MASVMERSTHVTKAAQRIGGKTASITEEVNTRDKDSKSILGLFLINKFAGATIGEATSPYTPADSP